MMRRLPRLLAMFALLALVLTPQLGWAAAGSSTSMGSRGSRTYSAPPPTNTAPGIALPMQRSLTPQSQQSSPSYNQGYQRPPSMMGGLVRGLLLGGLIGMLFGGGFHGIFGLFGFLIQLFLVVMVVRFLWGMVSGGGSRAGNMPGGPGMFAQPGRPPVGMPSAPVAIGPADYQAFEQLLQAVQQAWTQHDVNTLRMVATPEMVSYFGEQLAEQTSRGVRNLVTNVHLEQGDLSEAWAEEGREYATVAMRFTMVDVTTDQAGHVVAGDPNLRTQATELWTFLRAPGGRWVLSAIQQVR